MVLSTRIFSANPVPKKRMFSVPAIYVLGPLQINRTPSVKFFLAKQISARAAAWWFDYWPRRSAERSRVAGDPRTPGPCGRSGRADDGVSERRQGLNTAARWVRGCTTISVLAITSRGAACVGRDVCRVHGCLRGRHGAAAGWVFEGVAFQCAHRGLRAAATKQAEWPGPRPGREGSIEGTCKKRS